MELLRSEILEFQYTPISETSASIFQYEGFDATRIYQLLKEKERNQTLLTNDVNLLCLIGMIRGTVIDRIKSTMSAAGGLELSRLVSKYNIKSRVAGNNKRDVITIGRIMSVFPHICLNHSTSNYRRDFGVVGNFELPEIARFPQFAALIPKDDTILFEQFVKWSIEMDNVINRGAGDPVRVRNFADITRRSCFFTKEQRFAIIAQLQQH